MFISGDAKRCLQLKRNVGHQRAIAIGLGYASDRISPEQIVVVMDSDEDVPDTIPKLVGDLSNDETDVVVATRGSSGIYALQSLLRALQKIFQDHDRPTN